MIERYESVTLRATKSGKCKCGKRLTRSTTFEQTINPFNKNSEGKFKSYNEIMAELKLERDAWLQKPPEHNRPTYYRWTTEQQQQYDNEGKTTVLMDCGFETEVIKP